MNPIEGFAAETSGEVAARSGSDSEMGRAVAPPPPPFLHFSHCRIKILTNWPLRVSLLASSLGGRGRVSDRCDFDLIFLTPIFHVTTTLW